MKAACIDTHVLSWYLLRPKRLGRAAMRLLQDADAGRAVVHVPAIVAIELSLLRQAGRKTVGVLELEALLAAQPAFRLLPMDFAQAKEFALLESVADPFDRLIIAAARAHGSALITADAGIRGSSLIDVIWD